MIKFKNKKGFTLAETMIVLVILGVVAAITVPALVNRHVEAERRTKLKKAMSVYDTALNKMVIENGIKSDTALVNWADSDTKNDCANTSVYFKAARNLEVNGNATNCKFRAADGVFWDISDIKKPLIALREQDLNAETAQSDTNRAFYMFSWFDENGSLRSNDMGKIDATNKADLEKLYDFIAGKSKTSLGEIAETSKPEPETTPKFNNIDWNSWQTTYNSAKEHIDGFGCQINGFKNCCYDEDECWDNNGFRLTLGNQKFYTVSLNQDDPLNELGVAYKSLINYGDGSSYVRYYNNKGPSEMSGYFDYSLGYESNCNSEGENCSECWDNNALCTSLGYTCNSMPCTK